MHDQSFFSNRTVVASCHCMLVLNSDIEKSVLRSTSPLALVSVSADKDCNNLIIEDRIKLMKIDGNAQPRVC